MFWGTVSSFSWLHLEAIAHALQRCNAIQIQFLPDFPDIGVNGPVKQRRIDSSDPVDQLFPRHDPSRILNQQF